MILPNNQSFYGFDQIEGLDCLSALQVRLTCPEPQTVVVHLGTVGAGAMPGVKRIVWRHELNKSDDVAPYVGGVRLNFLSRDRLPCTLAGIGICRAICQDQNQRKGRNDGSQEINQGNGFSGGGRGSAKLGEQAVHKHFLFYVSLPEKSPTGLKCTKTEDRRHPKSEEQANTVYLILTS